MLRGVARVTRWGLLALALTFLGWLPIGGCYVLSITLPHGTVSLGQDAGITIVSFGEAEPGRFGVVSVDWGTQLAVSPDAKVKRRELGIKVHSIPPEYRTFFPSLVPHYSRSSISGLGVTLTMMSMPLWLLAFICLAWPVTSFIIARRRHKRGFPVEPLQDVRDQKSEIRQSP